MRQIARGSQTPAAPTSRLRRLSASSDRSAVRFLVRLAATIALYLFASSFNFVFRDMMSAETRWEWWVPIWFTVGVGVFLIRIWGWPAILGVALGSTYVEISMGLSPHFAVVTGTVEAIQAILIIRLAIHPSFPLRRIEDDPRILLRYAFAILVVSAFLSAPLGAIVTTADLGESLRWGTTLWLRWILDNVVALLCITPALLFVYEDQRSMVRRGIGFVAALAFLGLLLAAPLRAPLEAGGAYAEFLLFPIVAIVALVRSRATVGLLILAMALAVSTTTALGYGAFSTWTDAEHSVLIVQGFIVALALTGHLAASSNFSQASLSEKLHMERHHMEEGWRTRFEALLADNDRLARESRRDPLTGVLNRKGFISTLRDRGFHDADRDIFYMDLDGFKAVNDEHGHGVGDRLLQEFADRLQREVGGDGLVARFGGDEFVVSASPDDCAVRLETRLRRVTEDLDVLRPLAGDVSVSLGHYRLDEHSDVETAICEADKAMYRDKRQSRKSRALAI